MEVLNVILFIVAFVSLTLSILSLIWVLYWIILDVWRQYSGFELFLRFLIWPSLIVYAVRNRHTQSIRRLRIPFYIFVIGIMVFVLTFTLMESIQS